MTFSASNRPQGEPGGTIDIGTMVRQLRKQVRDELSLDFRDDDPNSMRFAGAYPDGIVGDADDRRRIETGLDDRSATSGADPRGVAAAPPDGGS